MANEEPGPAGTPRGSKVDKGPAAPPDRESIPGVPRWVKLAVVIGVVIVLLVVAMLLIGGGDHGPGRHVGGTASPAGH